MKETTLHVTEPTTLLPFLMARLPGRGRNKTKALLTHRQVAVDGHVTTRHDHLLQTGQRVTIRAAGDASKRAHMNGIRVLYEDEYVIVADKPPGLLSIATDDEKEHTAYRTLMNYVQSGNPKARVFIVHRLDKDTSGVMMFARSEAVQQALQTGWKDLVLERSYAVVVEGLLAPSEGVIHTWLKETSTRTMYVSRVPGDGVEAITTYKVIQYGAAYSLLDVTLTTGRKNQIRVHMQSLGHSVAGDKRYGASTNPIGRLALHARVLSFRHPMTQEVLRFELDIPYSFRRLCSDSTSDT